MSGIYTSLDSEMVCPLCGDTNVHMDGVQVAARTLGQDGPIVEIGVAANGKVTDESDKIPRSRLVGIGRHHRIALTGWCEHCDAAFAFLFTEHQGTTLLEPVDLGAHDYGREAS